MRVRRGRRWAAVAASCVMAFASVVTAGTTVTTAEVRTPARQDLAADALQGVLHTADPGMLAQTVRRAHRTVADRAAQAPDATGSASVVFAAGLTTAELAAFADKRGLSVYAIEVKVPVGADVHTMWFNDVASVPGTTATKLDRITGAARLRYFQQADAAPAAQRQGLTRLAGGDYRVYRAELVGTNAGMAALVGDAAVRVVLPDADDRKVTALRGAQASAAAVEKAVPGTEIALDRTASAARGTPVTTSTGQNCAWQADGVLACQAPARTTVSGDAAVDAALPTTAGSTVVGDRSAPAKPASVQDDSSLWVGCNNGSDGQSCPNDNTYRPHPNTGGAEAFGVSVTNYQANQVIYICYAEWVPDPTGDATGGYWQYYCYPYAVITQAFTFGAARWDSRWGTQQTTIAAVGASRPISTLAYKFVDGLQPCVVQQFLATAECSRALQNSVFVPNTGLEDELLMGNPNCGPTPILGRKGTEEDRGNGCFYPSYAATTLPSAFLDTTFGDGQQYNLAIGSSNPALLAEGRTYSSYAEFWAYGNNNMIGQTAFHSVAVDSRVTDSLICRQKNNADPFCYFPVDSSRVSAILPFT
jgi:hypothetical protein